MEEFVKREGGPNGRVPIPESMRVNVTNSAAHCDKRKKSKLKPSLNHCLSHLPNLTRTSLSRSSFLRPYRRIPREGWACSRCTSCGSLRSFWSRCLRRQGAVKRECKIYWGLLWSKWKFPCFQSSLFLFSHFDRSVGEEPNLLEIRYRGPSSNPLPGWWKTVASSGSFLWNAVFHGPRCW